MPSKKDLWKKNDDICEICAKSIKKINTMNGQDPHKNMVKLTIPPPDSIVMNYDYEMDLRYLLLNVCDSCVLKYFNATTNESKFSEQSSGDLNHEWV